MTESRRMRWAWYVAYVGKTGIHIRYWQESQKRPSGRCTWVDNIKMDHRETGWGGVEWIDLAQDQWRALTNMVMNLWVP
jgi:hypothetical protein